MGKPDTITCQVGYEKLGMEERMFKLDQLHQNKHNEKIEIVNHENVGHHYIHEENMGLFMLLKGDNIVEIDDIQVESIDYTT